MVILVDHTFVAVDGDDARVALALANTLAALVVSCDLSKFAKHRVVRAVLAVIGWSSVQAITHAIDFQLIGHLPGIQ